MKSRNGKRRSRPAASRRSSSISRTDNGAAASRPRRFLIGRVNQTHMGGDDAPAFGKFNPGLHLAADFSRSRGPLIERGSNREVAAIGRDHGFRNGAAEADGGAGGAERFDLAVAV